MNNIESQSHPKKISRRQLLFRTGVYKEPFGAISATAVGLYTIFLSSAAGIKKEEFKTIEGQKRAFMLSKDAAIGAAIAVGVITAKEKLSSDNNETESRRDFLTRIINNVAAIPIFAASTHLGIGAVGHLDERIIQPILNQESMKDFASSQKQNTK